MKVMQVTPLLEFNIDILVKIDMNFQGGSHKARVAEFLICEAIKNGDLNTNHTVIEKTGGNFGLGLLYACLSRNIKVDLAIGLSYSLEKRNFLKRLGANLIGVDMLKDGFTPKQVIEHHLSNYKENNYYYTDQFNNKNCIIAHQNITGKEIYNQIVELGYHNHLIVLIMCAGTGASLMGVYNYLVNKKMLVKVVLVEPYGCDSQNGIFIEHNFEGMSVGVTPPFMDWTIVNEKIHITEDEMQREKLQFFQDTGYFIGNTSSACIVASKIYRSNNNMVNTKILTFVYDAGFWYL